MGRDSDEWLQCVQKSAAEFSTATSLLHLTARQTDHFFERYDVLLTPTVAEPPLVTGALQPKGLQALGFRILGRLNAGGLVNAFSGIDALAEDVFRFMPYTPVFNATGQPAMSLPLHWNDLGLPIGMHFVGRFGDEGTLFRLAGQLERSAPWFDRLPPVSA